MTWRRTAIEVAGLDSSRFSTARSATTSAPSSVRRVSSCRIWKKLSRISRPSVLPVGRSLTRPPGIHLGRIAWRLEFVLKDFCQLRGECPERPAPVGNGVLLDGEQLGEGTPVPFGGHEDGVV